MNASKSPGYPGYYPSLTGAGAAGPRYSPN
jgi:hypothetical protein